MPKRIYISLILGTLITLTIALLMYLNILPFEMLEEKLYDLRLRIRGKITPPPYVVIVAIDDKSLKKFGRWPWSRDKLARLTEIISRGRAKVIAFNILFAEAEKNDAVFAEAIRKAGNVLLPLAFEFKNKTPPVIEDFLYASSLSIIKNTYTLNAFPPIKAVGLYPCRKELSEAAKGLGHINMFPDKDGTLRMETMVIEYERDLYPSLDLRIAMVNQGLANEMIILNATESISLGDRIFPTDLKGRSPIYYYGPEGTFPYISASDILEGNVDPDTLREKIVLIGTTALGIYDLRVTPFSSNMPSVEKHANVVTSLLEGRSIVKLPFVYNLFVLLGTGFVLSNILTRLKAISGFIISLSLLSALFFTGYYLFVKKDLWIELSYPLVNMILISAAITVYRYAEEEIRAKRIRDMFSSYVTEKIVNELTKNPDMAKLGGDRREVTVLFSDIMGFTSFSEKHAPEDVVKILNEYLGAMTEVIFKWEGTLDKFSGDQIFAFWGAPVPQENHAELAVRCALNMVDRLKELHRKWDSEGRTPLKAGVGINTGEVLVGNIGAEGKKMEYTVIGDHVNLGARVEALTRKYNTDILITEFTLNKIRGAVKKFETDQVGHKDHIGHTLVKGLERVIVKGKEIPVRIYEVMSLEPASESKIIELKE